MTPLEPVRDPARAARGTLLGMNTPTGGEGGALRLVQVGFGGWGRDWAARVRATPEVRVVGTVDAVPEAARAAGKLYGLGDGACFTSLEGALAGTAADVVLVTAGAAAHAPLVRTALGAGKHVLVEKPFALTLSDAQALVDMAAAENLTLMVSQNYRFFPAAWTARRLVAEGALGEVGSVYTDFRVDMAARLPAGSPYFALPDPLLLDMAVHHFDLMRFTLGEAASVGCATWNPPGSPFTDAPVANATVGLRSGATVAYRGSWLGAPPTFWSGVWRVEGSSGVLTWTGRNGLDLSGEQVTLNGREIPLAPLPDLPRTGRRGVLLEFAEAVRTGREPLSSGRDNLGTLALTLAAIASAAAGRTVSL